MTSQLRWILVLAALAAFMTSLDTLVVTTALSTIRRDLGASVEQLEWTVNAFNLSFAVLLAGAALPAWMPTRPLQPVAEGGR